MNVSIPLEQGSVLRLASKLGEGESLGLNPFGTGQCLTTQINLNTVWYCSSQSLWNRAVSYDLRKTT